MSACVRPPSASSRRCSTSATSTCTCRKARRRDGPSAGVAMVTAIVSVTTGIRVHGDAAMTCEMMLRGRVLPIGGLKEKLLAGASRRHPDRADPGRERQSCRDQRQHPAGSRSLRSRAWTKCWRGLWSGNPRPSSGKRGRRSGRRPRPWWRKILPASPHISGTTIVSKRRPISLRFFYDASAARYRLFSHVGRPAGRLRLKPVVYLAGGCFGSFDP